MVTSLQWSFPVREHPDVVGGGKPCLHWKRAPNLPELLHLSP